MLWRMASLSTSTAYGLLGLLVGVARGLGVGVAGGLGVRVV